MQTLTNHMPPGGYYYRDERLLPWEVPMRSPLALEGVGAVAAALSMVRAQNPDKALSSDFQACLAEVVRFTCARFDALPAMKTRYCVETPNVIVESMPSAGIPPIRTVGGNCASCGGRKR